MINLDIYLNKNGSHEETKNVFFFNMCIQKCYLRWIILTSVNLGVIHIWRPLWGGEGGSVEMRCYRTKEVGGSECSGRSVFIIFFIKENWICAMTRHHAEPNNVLLTINLTFDSDIRQWNHPLMTPLHCLRAKSNNRIIKTT